MGSGEQTVADALVAALQRHEVKHIFGQSLPSALMLAAERAGIRQVAYRTENAGGAMADGYARISGKIGVVAAQNGPAATLLVAPLGEALKASVPLLALVQDVPRSSRDRNAFQEFDHVEMFRSCSKWVAVLDSAERLEHDIDLALVHALGGRPGPAVVLLPKDVLTAPAAPRSGRSTSSGRYPLDRPRPDGRQVQQAAKMLADAERPMIIAGGGVHAARACDQLAELQTAGIPVATTTMGKGAVDEAHPLSVGVVGSSMGALSPTSGQRQTIADADAILLVGTRTNENGTDVWRLLPPTASYAHLDIAAEEIGRNYESLRLLGDARSGLEDLLLELRALGFSPAEALATSISEVRSQDLRRSEIVTRSDASPIRPERVVSEIDRLIDGETILLADASYSSIWASTYLRSRRPGQRFLTPRGLAGLGWGIPMALGAQVAEAGKRVVCLLGDGAFAHTWAELETAVRERLPITIVLLDNAVLGYQKHAEIHLLGSHTSAVNLSKVDHAAIARACGALGRKVEDPADLSSALSEAMESDQPALVEVRVDPDAYPPITSWDDSARLAGAGIPSPAREPQN